MSIIKQKRQESPYKEEIFLYTAPYFLTYTTRSNIIKYDLNESNLVKILDTKQEYKKYNIRYDVFMNKLIVNENEEVTDEFTRKLLIELQNDETFSEFIKPLTYNMLERAISTVGEKNKIDWAKDYFLSLKGKWDGVPRTDKWIETVYNTKDSKYSDLYSFYGSAFLMAIVHRNIHIGHYTSKFDHVLTLHGIQGIKKSESIRILSLGRFNTIENDIGSKDFKQSLHSGNIIMDFDEGDMAYKSSVRKVKSVLSAQKDQFRLPYARTETTQYRRCCFTMTTNNNDFLRDASGDRRYWVVACGYEKSNTKWLEENIEQMYAEAYHRAIELKEVFFDIPDHLKVIEEESKEIYQEESVTSDEIKEWYSNLTKEHKEQGVSVKEVLKFLNTDGVNYSQNELRSLETKIGHTYAAMKLVKDRVMINGVRQIRYYERGN